MPDPLFPDFLEGWVVVFTRPGSSIPAMWTFPSEESARDYVEVAKTSGIIGKVVAICKALELSKLGQTP